MRKIIVLTLIISIFLGSQVRSDTVETIDYSFCNLLNSETVVATTSQLKHLAVAINRKLKVLSMYSYDDLNELKHYRTIKCSPNPYKTPKGLFHPTQFIPEFHKMFGDNNWCIYLTRFKDHFLIHSPIYSTPSIDKLKEYTYTGLGTLVSGGCIRVSTADARFLMNNLTFESPIYIYDSEFQPYQVEELPEITKGSRKDPTIQE